jgi:4,5-dihydroxyphthalate decarboxylase
MPRLSLSFAFANNPRTKALFTGQVEPEGIDLIPSEVGMSELAWRQFGFQEFQVSELSISSLLIARSKGIDSFVAFPVFSSRTFFHTGVLVREDAGIDEPSQLAGKRVGVPEYQQTAALWARGALQHEFGVDPRSIEWYMERPPEKSHGGVTGFTPPEGIHLQYMPRETDMGQMLQNGEIDAALLYISNNTNLVDRSTIVFGPGSGVRQLFPDRRAEATRYFSKTGIIHMNHTAVVRKDVLEQHPWVVLNLYSAFLRAREHAATQSKRQIDEMVNTAALEHPAAKAWVADPFPYGIQANRDAIEAAFAYSYEQGLSVRKMALEDVFYKGTLEL